MIDNKENTISVNTDTYNGGWPTRDDLPTKDPIGDVDEPENSFNTPIKFTKEQEKYFKFMRDKLLKSEGKCFNVGYVKKKECCDNPKKYENIISKNLQFYSCKNCGADLGNIV